MKFRNRIPFDTTVLPQYLLQSAAENTHREYTYSQFKVSSDLVAAGHQLVPGWSAQRLDVVILQPNPALGQPVQMRSPDLRAVVAHIIPAVIIRQNEHDIRRFGRDTSDRNEQKTQHEFPHPELQSDTEESLTNTRVIRTDSSHTPS